MTAKPVNMSIWLQHPVVDAWCFKKSDCAYLKEQLPNLKINLCENEVDFVKHLPATEIASAWLFRQEWLNLASKLRWLALPAAGKDYFSIELPPGVVMTNGTFHGPLMAETVLGMMLGMVRGVVDVRQQQNTDSWPREILSRRMRALRNSHVAILGFGNIGTWIGRLAKPFGVRITGIKRRISEKPDFLDEDDRIVTVRDIHRILPETDHLVLALPRSPETDHLIAARELELLPDHAFIYNVGRGNAIDENALAESLHNQAIAGACLDVFEQEPLPENSPLRQCPNILLMPHASAIAPDYMRLFAAEFVQRYQDFVG